MLSMLWLAVFFLTTLVFADGKNRSFTVDYEQDTFLKDGEPFSFVAGDIHYFRVPRPYWQDRLIKMRAAGVDTLTTYIGWEFHEPSPGHYDFSGQLDFMEFLRIATLLDFNIIFRPGPYINAELDLGGYPAWLLTKDPNIKLRTMDPCHIHYVKRWLDLLMPMIVPLLYGNGGNIILVQVENEFGLSPDLDKDYLRWLHNHLHSYVQDAAVLCTNDRVKDIREGMLPGVLETIDFGPSDTPLEEFSELRRYQPNGPLVVMEFYVGYVTYWGQAWNLVRPQSIVSNIETFLQNNISFNMYMFHGGTNFAFSAGSDPSFEFAITSYDYDAPISEAGDLTNKYFAIRDTIKKYRKLGDLPASKPRGNCSAFQLQPVCSLFSCPIGIEYPSSEWPVTFEALGQKYGFLSYSTTLYPPSFKSSRFQAIVRDKTTVFLDDIEVGVMQPGEMSEVQLPSRNDVGHSLRLLVENMGRRFLSLNEKRTKIEVGVMQPGEMSEGQSLRLLVENMGRRFLSLNENRTKGLISNATVGGELLSNWKITGYPFNPEDIAKLNYLAFNEEKISFPAVFRGSFTLGKGEDPLDTFLSMEDWGKGVAFVNDHNLGRYWEIGPQLTLYVPATFLRAHPAPNIVTIMELYKTHPSRKIEFLQGPVIVGNFAYKFD